MKVVALGCSVGPNTLIVTSNIIGMVDNARTCLNRKPATFQFYLNDLFGNDFNTIFKSLPDFYTRLVEDNGHKFGPCFINATPGSYYGRLFPISTSPPEVYKAYLKQSQEGFKLFLKSRWEELMPGGAMVLVFPGRNETPRRSLREVISLTLNDMLLEVLIEDEKLDSFNIPVYEPTVEEIRHVILEEESLFLQRLDIFTMSWDEGINDSFLDGNIRAEFVAKYTRAVMERLFYLQSSRQKL
ncbi:hypothetical protein JHK82_026169 [Glycine max]|nr:hypothetical protein JHK85_026780 [Glycine max]KAG5134981.1 hypothetical protein JHK82_026169 [Glycine max]